MTGAVPGVFRRVVFQGTAHVRTARPCRRQQMERRLSECAALGFKHVVMARATGSIRIPDGLSVIHVGDVQEMIRRLFGKASESENA